MAGIQGPVLIFGATGRQGGSVVKALLRAKWAVRALVRDPAAPKSIALRDAGVELVQGSLTDVDVIRTAMRGAYGVFSVLPANLAHEDEVRLGCAIADLAAECNVAHFIYSSGGSVGETLTGVARFDAKPRIEAHIRTLPVIATIIRPMIFMEMLLKPGFGLDEGRYTFFLRPEQSMQLVAVEDIGKFVAAVFADKARFAGETWKVASDTVTGHELEVVFSEIIGRPIAYTQFSREFLAEHPDLEHMTESLRSGPLSDHVDLNVMREINPDILSFRSWLFGSGRHALDECLGTAG